MFIMEGVKRMDCISIVVPCFNEEEALPLFYERISAVLSEMPQIDYELLFVDDGSSDETLPLLQALIHADDQVRYLSFSRNFGKEAAMYAGFSEAVGDYIVVMDIDLQHPPELLPKMYQMLKAENVDCVGGKRVSRTGEKKLRSLLSRAFYRVANILSTVSMKDGEGDFRMMSRRMVEAILSVKEYNRYSKGIFQFVGFETRWIEYENVPRVAGQTKWSFLSLLRYAVDGIFSFSAVPLVLASYCGLLFCIFSFIMGIYIAGKTILFGNSVSGWTTLVCILLLGFGLQMLFIGLLGQYVAKNYMESKHRPLYFFKESGGMKPKFEKDKRQLDRKSHVRSL